MRVVELRDERQGLEAFIVVDHDQFPVSAGGTRMLPDVDVHEVARLARAMTWKFAACRAPYAGAKAGIRFAGGDRAAVLAAYKRALEPYSDVFLTGPDMGTFPGDFLDGGEDPVPLWARTHEGSDGRLAAGHGVKAAAEAGLRYRAARSRGSRRDRGPRKGGCGTARACVRAGARLVGVSTVHGSWLTRKDSTSRSSSRWVSVTAIGSSSTGRGSRARARRFSNSTATCSCPALGRLDHV